MPVQELKLQKNVRRRESEVRSSRGKTRKKKNVNQFVIVRDSGCQGNRGGNPHSCCPANVAFKSYEEIVDTVQGFTLESTVRVCFHAVHLACLIFYNFRNSWCR